MNRFAKENKFTASQTSLLFSLFKISLDKLIGKLIFSIYINQLIHLFIESCFQSFVFVDEFKSLILKQFKLDSNTINGQALQLNHEIYQLIIQYITKSYV